MKKVKKLYVIDPKIKWSVFKILHSKLVKDSGPTPKNAEKVLWEMLRNKQILLWFHEGIPNDMGIGLELPPHKKLFVLSNPSLLLTKNKE